MIVRGPINMPPTTRLCPRCRQMQPSHMVYVVKYFHIDKNGARAGVKYFGYICHWCNKKMAAEEENRKAGLGLLDKWNR